MGAVAVQCEIGRRVVSDARDLGGQGVGVEVAAVVVESARRVVGTRVRAHAAKARVHDADVDVQDRVELARV